MQQEKQPRPQDYGYEEPHIEVEGGWCIEGGQEAYEDAMERWNAAQNPNEGDLEALESQQEQAARLRDESEQDQDAEETFGEHWHNLMMQHTKADLVFALKVALER